ncbi:ferredoxin--NADP reductase [Noviherbaspirillum massiliense]|uniref:ferredoxin--NADP reductase n=1 Tax=Noviherbaspirillum massiliense TaxID=1465823 RepID=UPI0002EFCCD0|nr:FAD-dependent oxidoreductase [Noviherbaspirillum massiliense]
MAAHETNLEKSREIAEGTMAFHFRKPAGFRFKPGQAIDLVLPDRENPEADSLRHAFSIVSAPHEEELIIATRMRDSAFKRALRALPVGSPAGIEGPFGSLGLHGDAARPAVFIAGGIGITPFMSMLRHAAHERLPHRLLLLYANRRPEDAAFLDELLQLEKRNGRFRLIAAMSRLHNSSRPWEGRTGYIDETLIRSVSADLPVPVYYLAGPPGMVDGMNSLLLRMDVAPEHICSESFYGYP